jgi:hypothetical protein
MRQPSFTFQKDLKIVKMWNEQGFRHTPKRTEETVMYYGQYIEYKLVILNTCTKKR